MKRNEKIRLIVLIAAVLLAILIGIGLMVYPMVSERYNTAVRAEVYSKYEENLVEQDASELDAIRQAAIEYNQKLYEKEIAVTSEEEVQASGYWDQLNIPGTDIMCYVHIPCIAVELPVYHGIGDNALGVGAGHMPQSSLPVGGENAHSVISAHTGMASASMFSDLPLVKVGDVFYINILGETLTYEVYNTIEVLPQEIDYIQIQPGEDLCTLITCVPYGVNTHRLLVQGKRIPTTDTAAAETTATIPTEEQKSIYVSEYRKTVIIGVCIILFFLLLAVAAVVFWQRRQQKMTQEPGSKNTKRNPAREDD